MHTGNVIFRNIEEKLLYVLLEWRTAILSSGTVDCDHLANNYAKIRKICRHSKQLEHVYILLRVLGELSFAFVRSFSIQVIVQRYSNIYTLATKFSSHVNATKPTSGHLSSTLRIRCTYLCLSLSLVNTLLFKQAILFRFLPGFLCHYFRLVFSPHSSFTRSFTSSPHIRTVISHFHAHIEHSPTGHWSSPTAGTCKLQTNLLIRRAEISRACLRPRLSDRYCWISSS